MNREHKILTIGAIFLAYFSGALAVELQNPPVGWVGYGLAMWLVLWAINQKSNE